MTSKPASRSARATIFAPRSWPSRPGLATITRSFSGMRGSLANSLGCNASRRRRRMRGMTEFGYADDGAYIAYRIDGDGPIDIVQQPDWPGNIDLDWDDAWSGGW